jgi:hypothetical protein
MPRVSKDNKSLDEIRRDIEEAPKEAEETAHEEDSQKKKPTNWALWYIIFAIVFFLLGLLVISLINLGYDGYWHL